MSDLGYDDFEGMIGNDFDNDKRAEEHFEFDPRYNGYILSTPMKTVRTTKVITLEEYVEFSNDKDHLKNPKLLGRRIFQSLLIPPDRVMLQFEDTFISESAKAKGVALPPGIYNVVSPGGGGMVVLQKYKFSADEYVPLADNTQEIAAEIDKFLSMKDHYHKLGLVHKRGLLLYGPPGTGKTRLIEYIAKQFVGRARILFMAHAHVGMLHSLKGKLEDMPTIIMLEEFTEQGGSNAVLGFLDGEESWDNCLVLATTNYPQHIPGNILDRPSRFDKLFKLDNPKADTRKTYLEAKLGKEFVTDKLVELTDGMSIAYLRELVVSVQVFGKDPITTLLEFQQRKDEVKEFAKLAKNKPMGYDNE